MIIKQYVGLQFSCLSCISCKRVLLNWDAVRTYIEVGNLDWAHSTSGRSTNVMSFKGEI